MNESSVSAAIDMIFFGEVVFIEESFADARNANKNAVWISFFSFALCQWPRPRIVFHDGRRPGIFRVVIIKSFLGEPRQNWRFRAGGRIPPGALLARCGGHFAFGLSAYCLA